MVSVSVSVSLVLFVSVTPAGGCTVTCAASEAPLTPGRTQPERDRETLSVPARSIADQFGEVEETLKMPSAGL